MSQSKVSKRVVICNPEGLHARPADLFVRRAIQYEAKIEVIKSGQRVDGKSILEILTLAAEKGTELEIEAVGSDAETALDSLAELIEKGFAIETTMDQEQAG